jgi:glutathione S-transferase
VITLCGFAISNYYNKVKLALLEKGIAFSEETVLTGSTDRPCCRFHRWPRCLCARLTACCAKSQVIVDWLR